MEDHETNINRVSRLIHILDYAFVQLDYLNTQISISAMHISIAFVNIDERKPNVNVDEGKPNVNANGSANDGRQQEKERVRMLQV